jgi:hypothetical protein
MRITNVTVVVTTTVAIAITISMTFNTTTIISMNTNDCAILCGKSSNAQTTTFYIDGGG